MIGLSVTCRMARIAGSTRSRRPNRTRTPIPDKPWKRPRRWTAMPADRRSCSGEARSSALPAIGFGDVVWDHVFVRQGPQHACGGVQPGVRSRKNRGEHNEVHHVAGERQTNGVEHQHEGAFVHTGVLPRNQRSHDHDGTMKKMTRRNRVVWIAFGMALSGSLVSPAVTPISSVPEKAKFTVSMVVNTGIHPLGNNPSFTKFSNSGAWSYP